MVKANLPERVNYLVSKTGSLRAASRESGIPRTTLKRVLDGTEPTKKTRDRINRQFRRIAPEEVKRREKRGKGVGAALVDEATARKLVDSYNRQGLNVRVFGRREFTVNDNGTNVVKTAYGQGSNVDDAKSTMNDNMMRYLDSYRAGDFSLVSAKEALYRVIPLTE